MCFERQDMEMKAQYETVQEEEAAFYTEVTSLVIISVADGF